MVADKVWDIESWVMMLWTESGKRGFEEGDELAIPWAFTICKMKCHVNKNMGLGEMFTADFSCK